MKSERRRNQKLKIYLLACLTSIIQKIVNPKIKIKRFNKTSCIFHLISTNVRCVRGKLLVFYFFSSSSYLSATSFLSASVSSDFQRFLLRIEKCFPVCYYSRRTIFLCNRFSSSEHAIDHFLFVRFDMSLYKLLIKLANDSIIRKCWFISN